MMTEIFKFFDYYSLRARLFPALLGMLPAILAAILWVPGALDAGSKIIAIAFGCGVFYFLADFARSRGKKIEPVLLQSWGGWPTTQWLRHSDANLPGDVRRRYHAFLSTQPGLTPMPSAHEERADARKADEIYASAVMWLKERCRGKAFPLVEKENATYGFRRNMLGLKPLALFLAAAILAIPGVQALLNHTDSLRYLPSEFFNAYTNLPADKLGGLAFALVALLVWSIVVNPRWVRTAGDQYARALLAGCDSLAGQKP